MEKYWKYLQGNEQTMKRFFMAVIEAVEDMKERDEEAYYKSFFTIHESIFGKHFNEDLAKKAVSEMENVDGTTGEHWSMQQTNSLLASQNLDYNKCDFYYVVNMLYSDFSNVLGNDASMYLKMAKAYMDDPDACEGEGKAYCLWKSRFFE